MADTGSAESPLETVTEADESGVLDAFSLLGNDTRLAILLALWQATDPFGNEGTWDPAEGSPIPFSELRERVGVRDSGQFNYHLGKLEGYFVEQIPEGYQLLPAGSKIVQSIIGIAGFNEVSLAPTEIELPCPLCGASTAVTYQNQRVYHVCTECEGNFDLGEKHPSSVIEAWISNPASLKNRSPSELYTARKTEALHLYSLRAAGVCPQCSGRLKTALHLCEDHDSSAGEPCQSCGRRYRAAARLACTICKDASQTSLAGLSGTHPVVMAFYWKQGVKYDRFDLETADRLGKVVTKAEGETDITSTDPPRARVGHTHGGNEIQLTFDEELNVVEVAESD